MFLFVTICLLGLTTSQKVTDLTSCLTKENNLRMNCKYELTAESPKAGCKYTMGSKVVISTDPLDIQDPTYKNRANLTMVEGNSCSLSLTGLSDDKPMNFTCFIKQTQTVNKTATVEKKGLLPCSGLSILLQNSSDLLLAVMSLALLPQVLWL